MIRNKFFILLLSCSILQNVSSDNRPIYFGAAIGLPIASLLIAKQAYQVALKKQKLHKDLYPSELSSIPLSSFKDFCITLFKNANNPRKIKTLLNEYPSLAALTWGNELLIPALLFYGTKQQTIASKKLFTEITTQTLQPPIKKNHFNGDTQELHSLVTTDMQAGTGCLLTETEIQVSQEQQDAPRAIIPLPVLVGQETQTQTNNFSVSRDTQTTQETKQDQSTNTQPFEELVGKEIQERMKSNNSAQTQTEKETPLDFNSVEIQVSQQREDVTTQINTQQQDDSTEIPLQEFTEQEIQTEAINALTIAETQTTQELQDKALQASTVLKDVSTENLPPQEVTDESIQTDTEDFSNASLVELKKTQAAMQALGIGTDDDAALKNTRTVETETEKMNRKFLVDRLIKLSLAEQGIQDLGKNYNFLLLISSQRERAEVFNRIMHNHPAQILSPAEQANIKEILKRKVQISDLLNQLIMEQQRLNSESRSPSKKQEQDENTLPTTLPEEKKRSRLFQRNYSPTPPATVRNFQTIVLNESKTN